MKIPGNNFFLTLPNAREREKSNADRVASPRQNTSRDFSRVKKL